MTKCMSSGRFDMSKEIEVSPSRLAHGTWCDRKNKYVGEGDISAAYSADCIGSDQPVRKPFVHEGQKWISGGCCGNSAYGYRLVHPSCFEGKTFTYSERVRDGHNGRSDFNGFYHGMKVKHGGETMVLCGPEVRFIAGVEAQGNLFD
ncbi:hypothetical protein [Parasphingorhabdus sp.]|uniref:hypothetical protein n=1 Tax=Parasphingorhabdus sp. TaxID=2709688 RepID=UPI003D295582